MQRKHETTYSRETFDNALHEAEDAGKRVDDDRSKMTVEDRTNIDLHDLPTSQYDYFKAAEKVYDLYDQADKHARSLEAKHKKLLMAVQNAKRELLEFEKTELDMHRGDDKGVVELTRP